MSPARLELPSAPTPLEHQYVVGQDDRGRWIALEIHGLGGGLFRTRKAAEDYAAFETARRIGAITFATSPLSFSV